MVIDFSEIERDDFMADSGFLPEEIDIVRQEKIKEFKFLGSVLVLSQQYQYKFIAWCFVALFLGVAICEHFLSESSLSFFLVLMGILVIFTFYSTRLNFRDHRDMMESYRIEKEYVLTVKEFLEDVDGEFFGWKRCMKRFISRKTCIKSFANFPVAE